MRIVCQSCQAAYAIDDRVIGPRGVRAQCPKCGSLQVVHRDPQAAQAPPPPAPARPAPPSAFPPAPGASWDSPPPPARPAPPADFPPAPGASWDSPPSSSPVEVDDALLAPREATQGCRECGKALTDPFDQALGLCDECRSRVEPTDGGETTAPAPPPPRAPTPPPAPERRPPRPGAVLSAARTDLEDEGAAKKSRVLWLVAAVVLLAAGASIFVFRDQVFGGGAGDRANVLPAAVEQSLAAFRVAHPQVSGTAQDHLARGRDLLREDLAASYREARAELEQALLLDPRSDEAIAGWIRAVALGEGERMPDALYERAEGLARAALARSGRAPAIRVARAHLLLARPGKLGNVEAARGLAEEALEDAKDPATKADAHLAIGRSWLRTASPLAVAALTRALELDPGLKVALGLRARAHEGAGELQAALSDLDARLRLDPGHWPSSLALARILRLAGRPDEARRVFEARLRARPEDRLAALELAVLDYQTQGQPGRGLAALRKLGEGAKDAAPEVAFRILTHLACAERLYGSRDAAVAAAQRALEVKGAGDDPSPHLQLLLVALGTGDAAAAAGHLEALAGKSGEPAIEKLLEGRLRALEGKWAEAEAAYAEAATLDSRRTDALLLAGAAAAQAKRRDAAFRHLYQAAHRDPLRPSPAPVSDLLYLLPRRFLDRAAQALPQLREGSDPLLSDLYEAVLRYHQGELKAAKRLLEGVLEVDSQNALGQAWLSFVSLGLEDGRGAVAAGRKAEGADRQMALSHYALGAALARTRDGEGARKALRQALELDRGLLGAEHLLATLDARQGDRASAKERLARVVSLDPSFQPARQLLYTVSREDKR